MKLQNLTIIFISILILTASGCKTKNKSNKKSYWADTTYLTRQEKEQRQIWVNFREAVISNDFNAFKKMAMPCIYCPECNTYIKGPSPDTTNDYTIPVTDDFFVNSYKKVFSKELKNFYFNYDNLSWIEVTKISDTDFIDCPGKYKTTNSEGLDISISDKKCSGEECSQTLFSFIKTDKGYKLYSILDIP